jgi:hypothetical protein
MVLAGLLAVWMLTTGPAGVKYEGRPLADLLALEVPKDLSKPVASLGPRALPVLAEALEPRPGVLETLGVRKADHGRLTRARVAAVVLLSSWGTEAAELLPVLARVASGGDPAQDLALLACANVAPESPQVTGMVLERLRGVSASRSSAARIIHLAGLRDPRFVAPLTAAMQDIKIGRPLDRLPADEILALSLQTNGAGAIAEMLRGWEIRELRGALLAAFREFGPSAGPAVPMLTEALNDDGSRPFWPNILHVLARIGPAAEPAATVLSKRLESRDPLIRGMAALAAAAIRQSTNYAVTALITQLQDTNYGNARATLPLKVGEKYVGLGHREAAAWFLAEIGPAAVEALPTLRSLEREPNVWLRLFSARAVWRISGETGSALGAIERELGNDAEDSGVWACGLAGEIGSRAAAMEPLLKRAMTRSLQLRRAAYDALKKIQAS